MCINSPGIFSFIISKLVGDGLHTGAKYRESLKSVHTFISMLLAQRQSKVAPQFVLHISSPYTFPSLQITEACFMGGGYSQLTP